MRAMTLTPRFQVRRVLLNPVLTLVLFLLAGAYGVAQTANDNWISTGTHPTPMVAQLSYAIISVGIGPFVRDGRCRPGASFLHAR
jgi:hypothetical protein